MNCMLVLMLSAWCVFSHVILTTKLRSQCHEYPHFVYTGRTWGLNRLINSAKPGNLVGVYECIWMTTKLVPSPCDVLETVMVPGCSPSRSYVTCGSSDDAGASPAPSGFGRFARVGSWCGWSFACKVITTVLNLPSVYVEFHVHL